MLWNTFQRLRSWQCTLLGCRRHRPCGIVGAIRLINHCNQKKQATCLTTSCSSTCKTAKQPKCPPFAPAPPQEICLGVGTSMEPKMMTHLKMKYDSGEAVSLATNLSTRVLYLLNHGHGNVLKPDILLPWEVDKGLTYLSPANVTCGNCNREQAFMFFQDTNAHNTKQRDKNIAPADDPKQKLRALHRKIQSEMPMFFEDGNSWRDFSIYTQRVELHITPKFRKQPYIFRGLPHYKRLTFLFRTTCKAYLRFPSLDVLSTSCSEDKKTIEVRWRVSGVPLHLMPIALFFRSNKKYFERFYDYMSILYVSEEGKIWRHDISKVRPVSQTIISQLNNLRKAVQASAVTPFVRKPTPT